MEEKEKLYRCDGFSHHPYGEDNIISSTALTAKIVKMVKSNLRRRKGGGREEAI